MVLTSHANGIFPPNNRIAFFLIASLARFQYKPEAKEDTKEKRKTEYPREKLLVKNSWIHSSLRILICYIQV